MALQIIEARVQAVWLTRKEMVTLKRGPDKGKTVERKRRFKKHFFRIGRHLRRRKHWHCRLQRAQARQICGEEVGQAIAQFIVAELLAATWQVDRR